jgi:predicted RNase H-like HicB family nuclease
MEVPMCDDVESMPLSPEELAEARPYALVIEWSEEDGKFLAIAPDLPGLVTSGRTRTEAAEMGEEAVAAWISAKRSWGRDIPPPKFSALPDYLRTEGELAETRRSA